MNSKRLLPCLAALLAAFVLLMASEIRAGDHQVFTFEFQKEKLQVSRIQQYDVIRYGGLQLSHEIAAPELPLELVRLALPPGRDISKITITALESETLEGRYDLLPTQPPHILSRRDVRLVEPDAAIYSSSDPYPREIVRVARHGYFSGYNIGALLVYPVQYVPSQKKLIFHSKIEVELSYGGGKRLPLPRRRARYAESLSRAVLKRLVRNPVSLARDPHGIVRSVSALPDEAHAYVIITADSLVGSFQPLADWKAKKGLSAEIVTTSWIYLSYPGADQQAEIRNFIKDAYQNWGTAWILLGGDVNIIPERMAYAMDCEMGQPWLNDIPCDLYYSDLDGSWDGNRNYVYGEVDDSIDMYPDVFVGRAPVENQGEAAALVDKILIYEKYPGGHELDMLFLGEILWVDPYTDSGVGKNHIDSLYVPERFDPIAKLYESLGNENHASVISALNAGQNIVNHCGHAWYTVLGIGADYLSISDMDALANGPKYSILFSIGCWPAAIDYDCIAEHFITNPAGGGVAFIGNSRYGWGSPGNPCYGYSDLFDQQFFKCIFDDSICHIGDALAFAKAAYVPFSAQENVYRWCEYEVNLLGDPEMPVWTEAARSLTVIYPDSVPLGNSLCPVTVTVENDPVEGALVCLMQDTVLYETGLTGHDGRVVFSVSTSDPSNPIHMTVTARNFTPYESTISTFADEPYVRISSYETNGSGKGYVTPGEQISVNACFKNFGSEIASGVSAVLRSNDEKIVMIDSTEWIGTLLPGDSSDISNAFSFEAGMDLMNSEVAYLNSEIADASDHLWASRISVTGTTPVISFDSYLVSDYLYGDGDGFAEPGETFSVLLTIQNSGLKTAQDVTASISSDDPHVMILQSELTFEDIPPSGQREASTSIEILGGCPVPCFPQIDMLFELQGGYEFADSFLISVGEIGFQDDLENGEGDWAHSGSVDLWHLTSHRKHSGNHSWYCGNEGPFEYDSNMDGNNLQSTPLDIGQGAELSFWCWYEYPTYGTDGLYVELNDGSGWTTLDYIGSGGALGTLTTGNDWLKYTYDLSSYPEGTSIVLRFRFVSDDSDVAEGVYIDDVTIIGIEWPSDSGPPVPVVSQWGMIVALLTLLSAGTMAIRRKRRLQLRQQ